MTEGLSAAIVEAVGSTGLAGDECLNRFLVSNLGMKAELQKCNEGRTAGM